MARYLLAAKDDEILLPVGSGIGGGLNSLGGYSDSDWAGDKKTRKSASCAVLMINNCTAAVIVRGQGAIAQSSAEAEVYAAAMTISELSHLQEVLGWLGVPMRMRLRCDSAACRSIIQRQGVGRARHLSTKVLWLQSMTASGRLVVEKVAGAENPADLGTKPLDANTHECHRELLSFKSVAPGRTAGRICSARALL